MASLSAPDLAARDQVLDSDTMLAMEIALYPPMPSRPCRFCLSLHGGSVFADFDADSDGSVFAVRVSFDGYGCCEPTNVGRMSARDSKALIAMVDAGSIEAAVVARMLRAYFQTNRDAFWSDALAHHGLL